MNAPALDLVIPVLPARDLSETLAFWASLGFDTVSQHPGYAVVRRGTLELHFSGHGFEGLDPAASYAMCYLRMADVDALHGVMQAAGLPAEGIPRLSAVEDQPWGMREFHVVDPNGTLARIGTPTA